MLATTTTQKMNIFWKTSPEPEFITYIPSPLLLLMATDNGWDIVKAELNPSQDQYGFVYLLTLECRSDGRCQELVVPKNALVDKILEQRGPEVIPVG